MDSRDELAADVERTARALLALDLAPGERVALWMPNRPEWLHAFYAAATVGVVVVPLNTRFRAAEVENVLRQSGAAAVLATDRFGPIAYGEILRELCPELASAGTPLRAARLKRGRRSHAGAPEVVADQRVPRATRGERVCAISGDALVVEHAGARERRERGLALALPEPSLSELPVEVVDAQVAHPERPERRLEDGSVGLGAHEVSSRLPPLPRPLPPRRRRRRHALRRPLPAPTATGAAAPR